MIFDQYTGFYFFSSLFQGNIAFLALAGVFTVYRLQLISQILNAKETEIIDYVSHRFQAAMSRVPEDVLTAFGNLRTLQESLVAYHEKLVETQHWKSTVHHLAIDKKLAVLIRQWDQSSKARITIPREAQRPFIWILAIVLLSLIGLPLSSIIHSAGPATETLTIGIMVALNAAAIIINSAYTFKLLRESRSTQSEE